VCQRAECTVSGGVRIAADHGHARQGCSLLRADHMDDALARVVHRELEDAEVRAVLAQRAHLRARDFVGDGGQSADALGLGGRHVVVGRGEVGIHPPRFPPGQPQPFERLRRGHLVQDVAVDVEQRGAVVAAADLVHLPQLVVQGLAGHWRVSRRIYGQTAGFPSMTQMDIFHPFDSH